MPNPNGRPKGSKNKLAPVRLPFRQSEITRAVRSVLSMGLSIEKIEINPRDGSFTVVPAEPREKALA
jgi:hypothetical protein